MSEQEKKSRTGALFAAAGFDRLTRIQQKASPRILQRRDCLVIAPTGSGKTECAVIPVFHQISQDDCRRGISCLYITPLRALNRDVFRRIEEYAKKNGLQARVRHGDTSAAEKRRIAESPPDIVITTPETAIVMLSQQKMLEALSSLKWVIVDEVHELLPSERGSQLSITMERLQDNSRYALTRIGLSATVGNPQEAAKFVAGSRRKCLILQDGALRRYDIEVRLERGGISGVADLIAAYLSDSGTISPVLLFTNTRSEAELLASVLKSRTAIPVQMHHGSLSKQVREETEKMLRGGSGGIIVCTSSLELGIDIGSVDTVIHYGSPRQVSKMMQRIGRSRHSGGRPAHGLVVAAHADDYIETRAILSRMKRRSIEKQRIHQGPLDVLAHHMAGLLYQSETVTVGRVLKMAGAAYPYRHLTEPDILDILEMLDESRVVAFDRNSMSYNATSRTFWYHMENLSTIPDILRFKVFDSIGKRTIGSLDQRFVGDYGEAGNLFVLKCSQWRILAVDEKAFRVSVEPHGRVGTTIPRWEGETMPVDLKTAEEVASLRLEGERSVAGAPAQVIRVESNRYQGILVLHACFGTRINLTLSDILSVVLSSMAGAPVRARSDAYRITLSSSHRITDSQIRETLQGDYDIYEIVTASVAGKHNINWRVWGAARKFGVIRRGTPYERRRARGIYERYRDTPLVREALRELFHEKYDIPGTQAVLEGIRGGAIPVSWEETDEFSELAAPILDHASGRHTSSSHIDPELLEAVKQRLYKTKHRLLCARCGRWQTVMETRHITEAPRCPRCGARQVAATFYSDFDLAKIVSKRFEGGTLTGEEERRYRRAWKTASLVETFGVTAIMVLSGYGVGADTAARILRSMVDENHMFRQIYEAERQYVMTRGFWDQ